MAGFLIAILSGALMSIRECLIRELQRAAAYG